MPLRLPHHILGQGRAREVAVKDRFKEDTVAVRTSEKLYGLKVIVPASERVHDLDHTRNYTLSSAHHRLSEARCTHFTLATIHLERSVEFCSRDKRKHLLFILIPLFCCTYFVFVYKTRKM